MKYIEQLFDIKDKVFVLTGGGGVLAGTISEGLAKAEAKVVLLDIRKENAEARANKIVSEGGIAKAFETNVLDVDILEQTKKKIIEEFGQVDVLVNLAGGNMAGATIAPDKNIFDLNIGDFDKVLALNLNGTVYPSMIFGKHMAERKKGIIINISSMAAFRAMTRVVGYSAAKAAVSNFTKWMAMELSMKFGDGMRVNAIAPGFFIGDQNRDLLLNKDGSYTERGKLVIANTPMKRFGNAEELIGAVIFLSSNASSFINGVVLPIDGGFESFSGV